MTLSADISCYFIDMLTGSHTPILDYEKLNAEADKFFKTLPQDQRSSNSLEEACKFLERGHDPDFWKKKQLNLISRFFGKKVELSDRIKYWNSKSKDLLIALSQIFCRTLHTTRIQEQVEHIRNDTNLIALKDAPPLSSKYPNIADRIIRASVGAVDLNPDRRSEKYIKSIEQLKYGLPFVEKGFSNLANLLNPNDFERTQMLYNLKMDPRTTNLSPNDLWNFILKNYSLNNFKFRASKSDITDLFKEHITQETINKKEWFEIFVTLCLKEGNLKTKIKSFEFIENVAFTSPMELHNTHFYMYLKRWFSNLEIEKILEEADKLSGSSSFDPLIRRKEALLYFAAHSSIFDNQINSHQNIFCENLVQKEKSLSEEDLINAYKYLENPASFLSAEHTVEEGAKTLIDLGRRFYGLRANAEESKDWFWFSALWNNLSKTKQEIISNKEKWILQGAKGLEHVINHAIRNINPIHPLDVHLNFSEMTKKKKMLELPGREIEVTEQFYKDCDRYAELILVFSQNEATLFPGKYPNKKEATPTLISQLNQLASMDETLVFLLQELLTQSATKMGTIQWLEDDLLKRLGMHKPFGYIPVIPENTSIAVKKENADLFIIEQDYLLKTLNPIEEKFGQNTQVRVKYEIRRFNKEDGTWEWRVQQPEWIPLLFVQDPLPYPPSVPSLSEVYKPRPVEPFVEPLEKPSKFVIM